MRTPASLTGLAVVNTDTTSGITVTFTSYENDGSPTPAGPSGNPVSITVAPRNQVARLASELFGSTAASAGSWMKVTANRPGIKGFFLNFDSALGAMDGVPLATRPVNDFVIPELQNAEISLVNPGSSPATLTIRLIGNAGAELAQPVMMQVAPNARSVTRAAELFPQAGSFDEAYLRISSASAFISAEQFGAPGPYTNVLSGLVSDMGSRFLYSPQYVVGGGYRSTLTLVNLDDAQTGIRMNWTDNDGNRIGQNVEVVLPSRGRTVITDADVFGAAVPAAGLSGYLVISSDTTRGRRK